MIIASIDNEILSFVDPQGVRNHPLPWTQPVSYVNGVKDARFNIVLGRLIDDEPLLLSQWDDMSSPYSKRIMAHVGRVACMEQVCEVFSASPDEIVNGFVIFDLQRHMPSVLYAHGALGLASDKYRADFTTPMKWPYRSRALAWMLQNPLAAKYPAEILFGYEHTVARHMDISIDHEFARQRTAAEIDLDVAVRSLIMHVNTAASIALDTPQEVTLDVGDEKDRFKVTFCNQRLTPSVKGLTVRLPTQGTLFYRNAILQHGNVMVNNRAIPRRKIALDIIRSIANHMATWVVFSKYFGCPWPPCVDAWSSYTRHLQQPR